MILSQRLILASASKTRLNLLKNAGFDIECKSANVNETKVKQELAKEAVSAVGVAQKLAELKALEISKKYPDALVIGGDQTLDCEDILIDKPDGIEGVRQHMRFLRGKTHRLNAAVCIMKNEKICWQICNSAFLTMWNFDDIFIEKYIQKANSDICESVGGYRLEDLGAQLFSSIKGDYFTILGLPLLPLIGFLREKGWRL